jgi:hypothetical protein
MRSIRIAILAGALSCSTVPMLKAAPEPCSASDLSGAYGLLQSGDILSVGPFSSIGLATFDGNGHWTLTQTVSVNGDFSPNVGSGEYAVTADCTGTLVLRSGGSTAVRNMSMILLNYGTEIETIVTDAGNVTTAVLKSIKSRQCTNATLKGDYSYVQKGAVVGEGPFASLGFTRFDGEGNLTTIEFTSRNGMIAPDPSPVVFGSGTYQVNADCTGSATASGRSRALVIVDRGAEYYTMVSVAGRVIPGVQKRQE